jgi:hypothetical protein
MEIVFHDPGEMSLPPNETRIRSLSAEPWPDGRRVDVTVEITPFQQRPNLHIGIYDVHGQEIASVGAMQIHQKQVAFTLHLRQSDTRGRYKVSACLVYPDLDLDLDIVDQAESAFEIP